MDSSWHCLHRIQVEGTDGKTSRSTDMLTSFLSKDPTRGALIASYLVRIQTHQWKCDTLLTLHTADSLKHASNNCPRTSIVHSFCSWKAKELITCKGRIYTSKADTTMPSWLIICRLGTQQLQSLVTSVPTGQATGIATKLGRSNYKQMAH